MIMRRRTKQMRAKDDDVGQSEAGRAYMLQTMQQGQ